MKTTLQICLILLAVGLPLYLLYWNLFRPVLLLRQKYRLFEARDELRLLAIRGDVGQNEKAYPILERWCNRAIAVVERVDLADVFAARIGKAVELEVQRDFEVVNAASAHLRKLFTHVAFATWGAALVNSPGFLIVAAPFVIFLVLVLWFNRTKNFLMNGYRRAWAFIYLQAA